jgi:hypothetical protein
MWKGKKKPKSHLARYINLLLAVLFFRKRKGTKRVDMKSRNIEESRTWFGTWSRTWFLRERKDLWILARSTKKTTLHTFERSCFCCFKSACRWFRWRAERERESMRASERAWQCISRTKEPFSVFLSFTQFWCVFLKLDSSLSPLSSISRCRSPCTLFAILVFCASSGRAFVRFVDDKKFWMLRYDTERVGSSSSFFFSLLCWVVLGLTDFLSWRVLAREPRRPVGVFRCLRLL